MTPNVYILFDDEIFAFGTKINYLIKWHDTENYAARSSARSPPDPTSDNKAVEHFDVFHSQKENKENQHTNMKSVGKAFKLLKPEWKSNSIIVNFSPPHT